MKLVLAAAFALALALAPAAFAKGSKGHCVGSDGADLTTATSQKACKKAGGKWQKSKMAKKGGGTGENTSPSGKESETKAPVGESTTKGQ